MKLSEMISYSIAEPYFEPAAKRLADELFRGSNAGDTEWSQEVFMRDHNINIDFQDWDNELERQWKEWLSEYALNLVQEAFEEIIERTEQQGNMIKLHREIHAPESWFEIGGLEAPLGVYWSYDEDSAEAHWGSGQDTDRSWLFTVWFPTNGIDWEWTLFQNAYPSYKHENEIRMQEGVTGVMEYLWVSSNAFSRNWQIVEDVHGMKVKT